MLLETLIIFSFNIHYIFLKARNCLFNELLKIDQINIFDTHFLLWGNEALPKSLNKIIFAPVHNYKVLEIQAGLTNM